jgi:hypothetical protein
MDEERGRFTINNRVAGLVESHPTKAPAQARASSLARLTGIVHSVFDRRARWGMENEWFYNESGEVFKTGKRRD